MYWYNLLKRWKQLILLFYTTSKEVCGNWKVLSLVIDVGEKVRPHLSLRVASKNHLITDPFLSVTFSLDWRKRIEINFVSVCSIQVSSGRDVPNENRNFRNKFQEDVGVNVKFLTYHYIKHIQMPFLYGTKPLMCWGKHC